MYIKHFIDTKWYVTGYYHLSEISVKPGDTVDAGSIIGKSGGALNSPGSGGTTGPHLHYEFATCTKEPSVGGDPRYTNCGFNAIDSATYTGWLTSVEQQYKRNISCKNQLGLSEESNFEVNPSALDEELNVDGYTQPWSLSQKTPNPLDTQTTQEES
jgi:hypothetical protein